MVLNCQELTLSELNYAIELLECPEQTFELSIESLVYRLRNAQEWTDITKIMSERPESIKNLFGVDYPITKK